MSSPPPSDGAAVDYFARNISFDGLSEMEFPRSMHLVATIRYVDAPAFHGPDADRILLAPADDDATLFRRMNYLKFRATEAMESNPAQAQAMLAQAVTVRNSLFERHHPLALFVVQRMTRLRRMLAENTSDANLALIRAIETFDVDRGVKFSAYAYPIIWREISAQMNALGRLRGIGSFDGTDDYDPIAQAMARNNPRTEDAVARWSQIATDLVEQLPALDREVICRRFGIGSDGSAPEYLEVIGRTLGCSAEWVRYVQARALKRLRTLATGVDLQGFDDA